MKQRHDTLGSILSALALPALLAAVFPYSALTFQARTPETAAAPHAAFVTLNHETRQAALRAARASWQGEAAHLRRTTADFSFGDLPPAVEPPVLNLSSRANHAQRCIVPYGRTPYLPRYAAAPAPALPHDKRELGTPAFARDELLELR